MAYIHPNQISDADWEALARVTGVPSSVLKSTSSLDIHIGIDEVVGWRFRTKAGHVLAFQMPGDSEQEIAPTKEFMEGLKSCLTTNS